MEMLIHRLQSSLEDGKLTSAEDDPHARLREAARKDWVVYSKPPFAGPEQVLRYLGRYTHRVAISNQRLVALDHDRVTFRWHDRARGNRNRLMTLHVAEFLRRFLLHVLPTGLMRIRHYGLLANPTRHEHLARCRQLLSVPNSPAPEPDQPASHHRPEQLLPDDSRRCPRCQTGHLVLIGPLSPTRSRAP